MSRHAQSSQLTVLFIGKNNPLALSQSIETIQQCECNIIESKLSSWGTTLTGHLLISGKWNQIAKAENLLSLLSQADDLQIILRRTDPPSNKTLMMSYAVYLVALDRPGVLAKVTNFFIEQETDIVELCSYIYPSRHTKSTMLSLSMQINLPADFEVADLRDEFMILCDEMNLDGVIELDKY